MVLHREHMEKLFESGFINLMNDYEEHLIGLFGARLLLGPDLVEREIRHMLLRP